MGRAKEKVNSGGKKVTAVTRAKGKRVVQGEGEREGLLGETGQIRGGKSQGGRM